MNIVMQKFNEADVPNVYAIWWTSQRDIEKIFSGQVPGVAMWPDKTPVDDLPPTIASELRSRNGRNGRGRLWISNDSFPAITGLKYWPEASAVAKIIMDDSRAGRRKHHTISRGQ